MKFINLDSREKQALKTAYRRLFPSLLIAFILCALLVSYVFFLNEEHNISGIQHKLITDAAMNYNNYISNLVSMVRSIEVDYIELIAKGYKNDEIRNLLLRHLEDHPTIDQLRFLDVDGMEIIRINKGINGPYVVPDNELQDKSARYYYSEAKLLGRNQFLFSALDLNIENKEIEIDPITGLPKPTFRIATPIVIDEQRIGYFVVNFLMRSYLTDLRHSCHMTGGFILMFDENGYIFNFPDSEYNFGFCYEAGSEQDKTIKNIFTKIDLSSESGTFIEDEIICTYAYFENIINLSNNYFWSENAPEKLYFMVCFDEHSSYCDYIKYSPLKFIIFSWKEQLITVFALLFVYFVSIFLYFMNNRYRFTNAFSDNRYKKSQIKKAFHNHDFINYYQPIINIQDGKILGIEALSRWKRQGKVLLPDMFMEEIRHYELFRNLDENTFLNLRADREKLKDVCSLSDIFFSINISRQTFEHMIKENSNSIIKFTDSEKKCIVIELLEDIVIHKNFADKIREMHNNGVQFAIDDFGTGNSNVAFIRSFENMKIKIDKAFVPRNVSDEKECVIIEAFVKMFVDWGHKLIVEGVESKEQYLYLKKMNVSGVQGFYFSMPLPLDQLMEFIQNKNYLGKL